MNCTDIIKTLKSHSNKKNVEGMARFGINPKNTLGVSMPIIRGMAKKIKKSQTKEQKHLLAQQLWKTKVHEARILAALIDDVTLVSEKQMDSWVKDFDSWDVCDQVCMTLFDKSRFAEKKIVEWSKHKKEFIKRAPFATIAAMASHRKDLNDRKFLEFLPIIKKASADERNFVRKAVNWALRGIGKRSLILNKAALKTAKEILKKNSDSKAARWIANDAIRELQDPKTVRRIRQ